VPIIIARFYLQAGGFPDDGTRRYVAERCALSASGLPLRDWFTMTTTMT